MKLEVIVLLISAFFVTLSALFKAALVVLGSLLGVVVFVSLCGLLIAAALAGLFES